MGSKDCGSRLAIKVALDYDLQVKFDTLIEEKLLSSRFFSALIVAPPLRERIPYIYFYYCSIADFDNLSQ